MGSKYSVPIAFPGRKPPEIMGRVLGIVYRCLATCMIKKAGFTRMTAQTGAVTIIQRFGSALNLNIHYHMPFLDGVYDEQVKGRLRFFQSRRSLTELRLVHNRGARCLLCSRCRRATTRRCLRPLLGPTSAGRPIWPEYGVVSSTAGAPLPW